MRSLRLMIQLRLFKFDEEAEHPKTQHLRPTENENYQLDQVINRKRKWTPLAVQTGKLVEGSEDAIKRALRLVTLSFLYVNFYSKA